MSISEWVNNMQRLYFIVDFNLVRGAAFNALMADLEASIEDPLDEDQNNGTLKALTGFVSQLDNNLACYPMGYPTTILFDQDGNQIFE